MFDNTNYIQEQIETLAISKAQMRFWFLDQMEPGNAACNVSRRYYLKGNPDVQHLQRSFELLIQRHEILRSAIVGGNGSPLLRILNSVDFNIEVFDISHLAQQEMLSKAARIANESAARPFILSKPPLFRANLVRLKDDEWIFTFVIHHIIIDGSSLGILFREFETIYECLVKNQPVSLPAVEKNYRDYINYLHQGQDEKDSAKKLNFWKKQLGGEIPLSEIPKDYNKSLTPTFNGARVYFSFDEALVSQLRKISKGNSCSLYTALLAAFKVLLYRYTGNTDLTIGSPVLNRAEDFKDCIGVFINMLPFRSRLDGNKCFRDFLQAERRVTFSAFANHDYPFEDIIANIHPYRSPMVHPVFQIMFQYITGKKPELYGLEVESMEIDTGKSQFDLSLYMWEWSNYLDGYYEFNSDLYNKDKIERLSVHFNLLLNSIVSDPLASIDQLSFLSDEETAKLLFLQNDTGRMYPTDKTVTDLFEESVCKNQEKIAVESGNAQLSYRMLNERANKLAGYLIEKNVKPGDLVGISTDRSADMIISLLAVMKTGAAYVPLDPTYPGDRLNYMIEDSGLTVIITQTEFLPLFANFKGMLLDIQKEKSIFDKFPAHLNKIEYSPDNRAYVIYTSGSTGRPKGVVILHRSVVNFLYSMMEKPGIYENDILLSVTSLSFDISILEIFLPLTKGAKVVLVPKEITYDGQMLLKNLRQSKANIMQATPSTWRLLISAGWNEKLNLKILCGGEPFNPDLAEQLLERCEELWNMYGPTETTIWSSVKKISANHKITLGSPIANTQFYVLDPNRKLLPEGIPGELYIGGAGLADGYLNNPELTAEKFIDNPFNDNREKIYRTGDIVRITSNGECEFLQRADNQVKLRGYRIELGEIESALYSYRYVNEAAVIIKEFKPGDVRLIAFVVMENQSKLNLSEVKLYLGKKLPEFMVPSLIIELEKLPLTPNGKVDKKALAAMAAVDTITKQERVEPRNETEMKLVKIWQKALGTDKVGVTDDFFELGGHSLLAVALFNEINKKFGTDLPLSLLFTSPTIEGISFHIKERKYNQAHPILLKLKNGNGRHPLFLVHGAGGNVFLYKELAEHLHNEIPVYGVQSIFLVNNDFTERKIIDMADRYVNEILTVQPEGPYHLAGYCMGGTVALEIAQQLQRRGKSVAMLALLETYNVNTLNKSALLKFFNKIQNLFFHIGNYLASSEGRALFFNKKLMVEKERITIRLKILLSRLRNLIKPASSPKYPHINVEKMNESAQNKYIPEKYRGKIILIKPKTYFAGSGDFNFGWSGITDELQVVTINVNPRGILVKPFVESLAKELNNAILEIKE